MTTYDNRPMPIHHPDRAYEYGLVDYVTGEVRFMACDRADIPLRHLYRAMDGLLRAARRDRQFCNLELWNNRTGETLVLIHEHFNKCYS